MELLGAYYVCFTSGLVLLTYACRSASHWRVVFSLSGAQFLLCHFVRKRNLLFCIKLGICTIPCLALYYTTR